MRVRRSYSICCLLCAAFVLSTAPAHATFPGANGTIAFSRYEDETGDNLHVWSMKPDGSHQTQLTSLPGENLEPAYSANGAKIAFSYCPNGGCDIAVANANGSGQQGLTQNVFGVFDDLPVFTPDGSMIVFEHVSSGTGSIEMVSAAGGTPKPLTDGSADAEAPDVSPDGTKIAFSRNGQIYVMGIDGSNPTAVSMPTFDDFDRSPSYSPDGTKIAFEREDTTTHAHTVEVIPASGGMADPVYTTPADSSGIEPVFSPDGTKIAFEECDPGNCSTAIKVINADGSGSPQTLTTGTGNGDFRAAWQPVAPRYLAFLTISGSPVNGSHLAASGTAASGATSSTLQWLRCDSHGNRCLPIPSATAATYDLASPDIGHTLRISQVVANAVGSVPRQSQATQGVAPNPARCSNVFSGTVAPDTIRGTAGGDRINGGDGADHLGGGPGDDCIDGGSGADSITGSAGNDTVSGGSGSDKITGGPGNDRISGGSGNDTISAGSGANVVSGGAGNDRINVVNGRRDHVNCGSGHRDVVHADAKDRLRGCERVIIARRHRSKHRNH